MTDRLLTNGLASALDKAADMFASYSALHSGEEARVAGLAALMFSACSDLADALNSVDDQGDSAHVEPEQGN